MSLDYNRIWSLINKNNLSKAKAARIAEMSETGFRQMMDRKTMAVSTLEKLANYFKMPITAFFEKEEIEYVSMVEEPQSYYQSCKSCEEKERTINALKQNIETQEKLINVLLEKKNRKDGTSG